MKMPEPCLAILFLLFISIPLGVTSKGMNAELNILLNFKRQLGNPPSLQSWTSSSSPCDWPEINCTVNSVTEVHLGNKNITVPIPPTICGLKNLILLDLSFNYITGEFPSLYKCSKLQTLDLSQNYFVGSIPDDIDRLSSLVYLDVGSNNFTGNIPPSIGRLPNLQTLNMYQSLYNGTFPKEIGYLSNLEVLSLAYNGFSPMRIPQEFARLKKLRVMWMTETNLIGEIPEYFNNMSSLQHLDLAGNNLEGPIPNRLLSLNLTHLYLFHNNLSGEIPRPVKAMNLVQIDLSRNHLTGSIPEDFGKLQNMDFFNLFSNQLTGELPASIGLLPALRIFRIFKNNLTGVLPPELGLHSKLEDFEVSDNQFSGQLPENLCSGGRLRGVVAFTNNLSGKVPKSLGNCPSLLTVQLHNNKFSGEIPPGIWTTFNMSLVLLSNNSFTGELPSLLGSNISRVVISDNRFSGVIPTTVSSWTSLVVFEASNNMFSGPIPKEITDLSGLTSLLLNGNDFSGELPSEIVSWVQLTTLDLSHNKLSGAIPASIGLLPDLLNLDLSDNQFSGEIPIGIGKQKLNSLNLSFNQLVGRIPSQLDNLAYENSFLNNTGLCADDSILKLPDCNSELGESKSGLSSKHLAIILTFVILICLAIFVLMIFLARVQRRNKLKRNLASWKLTSFQKLDFTECDILTNLTDKNLIGSGGSGKVYRILINHPDEFVAVKKIWNSRKLDNNLEKEFLAEVQILANIRHSNIVKLLCCISGDDSKLLVYEFMENLSLDKWLHLNKKSTESGTDSVFHTFLDWPTRLQIAVGAAQGLCYMHHESPTPIIHRDVKSSNILLDSEFNPKIADFGLARTLNKQACSHSMSGVAGSFGYLAPEYAYTTKVNAKVDVYSFGVVLLELVTGREANSIDQNKNLVEWALHHFSEEKPIAEILDPELRDSSNLEEMTTVFKIGIVCTRANPSSRPSMKEVLHVLRGCCPEDGQGTKKKGGDVDAAPLLDISTGTYLSNYKKNSKKGSNEDDTISYEV